MTRYVFQNSYFFSETFWNRHTSSEMNTTLSEMLVLKMKNVSTKEHEHSGLEHTTNTEDFRPGINLSEYIAKRLKLCISCPRISILISF